MFVALREPGGVRGVCLLGTTLSSITASPPSTFFFSCAIAAVAAIAVARRKERREPETLFFSEASDWSEAPV